MSVPSQLCPQLETLKHFFQHFGWTTIRFGSWGSERNAVELGSRAQVAWCSCDGLCVPCGVLFSLCSLLALSRHCMSLTGLCHGKQGFLVGFEVPCVWTQGDVHTCSVVNLSPQSGLRLYTATWNCFFKKRNNPCQTTLMWEWEVGMCQLMVVVVVCWASLLYVFFLFSKITSKADPFSLHFKWKEVPFSAKQTIIEAFSFSFAE